MNRVLVTGGSGFIGRHLCEELVKSRYEVVLFDPHGKKSEDLDIHQIQGDVLDINLLRKAAEGVTAIFHLAGVLGTDYLCGRVQEAVQVNILGTVNVLEVARQLKSKVINTGIVPDWDSPYMITKKAAMKIGRMYRKEFDIDVVTLEITHVYGPGQQTGPYHKAIPTFISRALKGLPIHIYGKGRKHMDCVYVTDVARAMRIAAESRNLESVHTIRSHEGMRVIELAKKIIELTGSSSRIEFVAMRPGEPEDKGEEDVLPDVMSPLPGWQPQVPFERGLPDTILWYRRHLLEA